MALICDTGPLLAALDAADPDHERCARLLMTADEDLVVPALVLAELDHWERAPSATRRLVPRSADQRPPSGSDLFGAREHPARGEEARVLKHAATLTQRYPEGMTSDFGPLVLFGSGETARSGRQVHEEVLSRFPSPVRVAILPTPAGFQPNADAVAERLADFVRRSLVNHRPEVVVVDAKRRGGDDSGAGDPDDPRVAVALEGARYVFAGPGSPTYMVRQLADTLTWTAVRRAWQAGAALALASAAAVAIGAHALPVYEIYKVGDDLGWRRGLDLCADIGLELAIVPHWNNTEGGAGLDTSRSYVGRERFEQLRKSLPPSAVVLGLDEHTSCIVDVTAGTVDVRGQGTITVLRGQEKTVVMAGERATTDLLRGVAWHGSVAERRFV